MQYVDAIKSKASDEKDVEICYTSRTIYFKSAPVVQQKRIGDTCFALEAYAQAFPDFSFAAMSNQVLCWNICGGGLTELEAIFASLALLETPWDVLCIQEASATLEEHFTSRDGHRCLRGAQRSQRHASLIALHSRWTGAVCDFSDGAGTWTHLTLQLDQAKLRIISGHITSTVVAEEWHDDFCELGLHLLPPGGGYNVVGLDANSSLAFRDGWTAALKDQPSVGHPETFAEGLLAF
eukprot:6992032-Prorocentrum_lima.AAC.1